jgi:hypothetical protein
VNPRTTLLLAVVTALLAGLIYFYEVRGAPEREIEAQAESLVFPGVEASDIRWIEIETSGGPSARVERVSEGEDGETTWQLREPLAFPADEVTADGLARGIATLAREREFEEAAALSDYGLEGDAKVRFGTDEGEHAIFVGAAAPFGEVTYLSIDDRSRVFAVQNGEVTPFSTDLKSMRDRRVVVYPDRDIAHVEVEWPSARVHAERSDDRWQLREPLDTRGDDGAIDGLISQIEFLRATDFVDEPGNAEKETLAAPDLRVALGPKDDPDATVLEIGKPVGDRRLVRVSGRETLFSMPESLLDDFPSGPVALRFRELASFSSRDAERFEMAFEDPERAQTFRVTGVRENAGWSTEPPMQSGKASRLVGEIDGLEASDVIAESMGSEELAGLGLSPPRVSIRIEGGAEEGEERPVLAEVQLGILDPARGIAARVPGAETVYWIDAESAEVLPISADAFENRFAVQEEPADSDSSESAAPGDDAAQPPQG